MRVEVVAADAGAGIAARAARWSRSFGAEVAVRPVGPAGPADAVASSTADAVVLTAGAHVDDPALAAAVREAAVPVVHADTDAVTGPSGAVRAACDRVVQGRGQASLRFAVRLAAALAAGPRPVTHAYGMNSAQVADWRPAAGDDGTEGAGQSGATQPPGPRPPPSGAPVVVLLHGGFWLHEWERDLMDPLAVDLAARGWATWNVEYRRLGPTGGGWPATLEDVRAAVAALPRAHGPVVAVGHSAGGHLAAWLAADGAVDGAVAVAGVLDVAAAVADRLGGGAVAAFAGTDPEAADPPPPQVPVVLVHGGADRVVPPAQSESLARRHGLALSVVHGEDHFAVLDPGSRTWAQTVAAVQRLPA